jgi:hypothetical protein
METTSFTSWQIQVRGSNPDVLPSTRHQWVLLLTSFIPPVLTRRLSRGACKCYSNSAIYPRLPFRVPKIRVVRGGMSFAGEKYQLELFLPDV